MANYDFMIAIRQDEDCKAWKADGLASSIPWFLTNNFLPIIKAERITYW